MGMLQAGTSDLGAERSFSIELVSNEHVRLRSLNGDSTVIDGTLGELEGLLSVEGVFLEIRGTLGTLRVDVTPSELRRLGKERTVVRGEGSR